MVETKKIKKTLVYNWEELSQFKQSNTHFLDVIAEDCIGFLRCKIDNWVIPEGWTGLSDGSACLDSHTFDFVNRSSKLLQLAGFNVELVRW